MTSEGTKSGNDQSVHNFRLNGFRVFRKEYFFTTDFLKILPSSCLPSIFFTPEAPSPAQPPSQVARRAGSSHERKKQIAPEQKPEVYFRRLSKSFLFKWERTGASPRFSLGKALSWSNLIVDGRNWMSDTCCRCGKVVLLLLFSGVFLVLCLC